MIGAEERCVVNARVNGQKISRFVEPRTSAAEFIRHELGLTGTHVGCEHGVCGSCTISLDGDVTRSCLLFAVQLDGRIVETIEGATASGRVRALQDAFVERNALQCGLLHARNDSHRRGVLDPACKTLACRDTRGAFGKSLSLHRLRGHRRCGRKSGDVVAMTMGSKAIGSSRPRTDARVLVEGRGIYLDDVATSAVLHVAFLRSPHAKATFEVIDIAAASGIDGVVRVITAADIAPICRSWETPQVYPGLKPRTQTALAEARVSYVGQPVVAIVAQTRALAEDAIELVEISWQSEDAASAPGEAMSANAAKAHSDLDSNLAYSSHLGDQIPDACFENAHAVVEEEFRFHRLTGCPMETRGSIASYTPGDGSLTIYQSHTAPHQLRSLYATHLGLNEGRIRVICPNVGGSFGVKIHLYSDEIATAACSRLLGRPVKFIADRLESFVSDIHAREQIVSARLAVDSDGRFLAWSATGRLAMGPFSSYPVSSVQEGDEALRLAMAPYNVPLLSGDLEVVFQNKTMNGAYRGVGHPIASAVSEYMIDRAADRLGIAPEELRRRNLLPDDGYPFRTRTGVDLDALSHEKCLRRLLELIDVESLRGEHAALRQQGTYRGIGFAAFVERTATSNPMAMHIRKATAQDGITLSIGPSGSVQCGISVTDQGQGTHAVIAQIISQELGVAVDDVNVVSGDSQATPYGSGVRASRGTAVGGELALQAARQLRDIVLTTAAGLLQADADDLSMSNGIIATKAAGTMTLADLAETVYFKPQLLPPGPQTHLTISRHLGHDWPSLVPTNGIQASLVEVDVTTGFIKLLRHWAVDDFGVIINPLLVEEQVRGGIAQGIGQALLEELLYTSDGQLTNGTFADYLLPTATEIPDIVVEHVETRWPHTMLGAKGAGEAGTTGALGAVLNAVNDAIRPLGAKITEVPMTPCRVLAALGRLS